MAKLHKKLPLHNLDNNRSCGTGQCWSFLVHKWYRKYQNTGKTKPQCIRQFSCVWLYAHGVRLSHDARLEKFYHVFISFVYQSFIKLHANLPEILYFPLSDKFLLLQIFSICYSSLEKGVGRVKNLGTHSLIVLDS